jgi:hypothetical protein
VTRGLTILAALATTLAVALPASAENSVIVRGTIASVSATSVTITGAKGVATTCVVLAKSPSLDGYATGDAVQAACLRLRAKLVLAKIRHVVAGGGSDTKSVTFGGVVTALSDSSISLHDGDRDLTCAIGPDSPSTAGAKVGGHAKVACANGVLVSLALVPSGDGKPAPPPGPEHKTVGANGTVSAVSPSSLTVHTDGSDVTCSVGDGSPSVADVRAGDKVKMGCVDGVLKVLARADAPPPPPPPPPPANVVTVGGTLTAVSDASLTVHNTEHGDVTCTRGPSSPSLGDFHVGDRVGMACADGVLVKIVRLT